MTTEAMAMDIPHVGAGTGVTNAKLGIWLFLASEIMLFSTLFTSYLVLRLGSLTWPRGWDMLNVPLGTLNTLVLITSSVTVVMAYAKAVERKRGQFRFFMGLTIFLGVVFLIIKGFEWGAHFKGGEFPSGSIFLAAYFTMTGLHAVHVIGGLITNSILLWLSESQWDHPLFVGRVEAAGLYWHFVDIVWIFLFPVLYLL